MKSDLVMIGRIIGPQGIKGELKMQPLSNIPGRFQGLDSVSIVHDEHAEPFNVEYTRPQRDLIILKLADVPDRTAAELFRGLLVAVPRERTAHLDEQSYFEFDLEGLPVYRADGSSIGTIARIEEYPGNPVVVIDTENEELLVPALRAIFTEIDVMRGRITADIPEGIPAIPKRR